MELAQLYDGCRTYRRFSQKKIAPELLRTLVDVARKRSCGHNGQILRYTVVSQPENVKAMQPLLRWAALIPQGKGGPREGEEPVAFIVVAKTADAPSVIADIDLGIALDAMAITAWQQGVGSAILAAVDRKKAAALLKIPREQTILAVLALGYPCMKSTLVEAEPGKGTAYSMDADRNYFVPKLPLDQVAVFK